MAGVTLSILDGAGKDAALAMYPDANNNLTPGHTPLVGGNPIAANNRVPVTLDASHGLATAARQDTANAALGTPADGPWVSGTGSIIGVLKGLGGLLAGVLNFNQKLGGQDISTTNRLPVALPASAATQAGQDLSNAALGTPSVVAWASGDGTVISILKGIFGRVAGVLSVRGSAVSGLSIYPATGTTSASILAANTNRRILLIRNQEEMVQWIAYGPTAVVGSCHRLEPGEGVFFDGITVPSNEISAISPSGPAKLFVMHA